MDGCFDLVVTQDVLEHVPSPERALGEIARTLRPGGRHVFTVPVIGGIATRPRALFRDGAIEHLLPPEHHFDPTTRAGALVFTDWGADAGDVLASWSGSGELREDVVRDPQIGVAGDVRVFTFVKRAT